MHQLTARKIKALEACFDQASTMKPDVEKLLERWKAVQAASSLPELEELFTLMNDTRRMELVIACGLQFQPYFVGAKMALAGPSWQGKDAFVMPHRGDAERLAKRLIDGVSLQNTDHVTLQSDYFCKEVLYATAEHCLKHDIDFDLDTPDTFFRESCLLQATPAALKNGYVPWLKARHDWVGKVIMVPVDMEYKETYRLSDDEKKELTEKLKGQISDMVLAQKRRRVNASAPDYTPWTLMYLPTPEEAQTDGMDYETYKTLFIQACDQPWPEIGAAQEKLIGAFDAGKQLRITNADGTDISFSIDGHQFANSGAVRNIPGAEFFSSPINHSVYGTIVAKGNFIEKREGLAVRDITLHVKDGRIESWDAAEGKDELGKVITAGDALPPDHPQFEGNRHFGEIGFGTNPHLTRHMCNGMLVEKISGSFHMAIGGSYGDGYLGKAVKMDNGNKGVGDFHWDVTTMLKGKDGEIWLDGHLMQKDGIWQAVPALGITADDVEVLNKGWAALPEPKRPKWFKDLAPDAPQQAVGM